jgi:hypothetical protein
MTNAPGENENTEPATPAGPNPDPRPDENGQGGPVADDETAPDTEGADTDGADDGRPFADSENGGNTEANPADSDDADDVDGPYGTEHELDE